MLTKNVWFSGIDLFLRNYDVFVIQETHTILYLIIYGDVHDDIINFVAAGLGSYKKMLKENHVYVK